MSSSAMARMSSPDFRARAEKVPAVIIPFGSLEAHGPHLPLGTDAIQAEEVALRVAERLGLAVAPTVPYGVCVSTRDHPGTVGIGTETLKRLVADLVTSLRRQGVRAFVLLSGHAGRSHLAALRDAAEELLAADPTLRLALVSEYDLVAEKCADLLDTPEDRHAGEIETSRLLHLAPELVAGSAPEEYPRFSPWILTADKKGAWPGSVWGNPAAASREKGASLMERSVEEVAAIVRELLGPREGGGA